MKKHAVDGLYAAKGDDYQRSDLVHGCLRFLWKQCLMHGRLSSSSRNYFSR
jgi:hypothetical protein